MNSSPGNAGLGDETADYFPWLECLFVFLSFALFATLRSPVPGVNEPHYLTKAKHFWDPTWCARDPFLKSANAHYVFYATVGWFTQILTLEQTAWLGRILGWLGLASGWCALVRGITPGRWNCLWSAWVFLSLAAIGNLSGEWVVGGIESKVICYACAWWSVAFALKGHPLRSAMMSGLAISFHPVVGIWHLAALFWGILCSQGRDLLKTPWQTGMGAISLCLLCALPGLVPAVDMLRAANSAHGFAADYIQVFHRLAHHLNPWRFRQSGYVMYGVLLALFMLLYSRARVSSSGRLLAGYLGGAVLVAMSGFAIRALPEAGRWLLLAHFWPAQSATWQAWVDYEPHLAKWLKFYPFRLADSVIPLIVSLQMTQWTGLWIAGRGWTAPSPGKSAAGPRDWLAWALFTLCFLGALATPTVDSNPSRLNPQQLSDWKEACAWLKSKTPADAVCFSGGNDGWALRWFAERAEYASNKDCPQDATAIVDWNDRLKRIGQWSKRNGNGNFSRQAARELRQLTGIDFVVVRRLGPFQLQPVHKNNTYRIYDLRELD